MPVRIDLTSNASVRMIDVNEDNLACAYLANLYIPIFNLETSKIIRRFEVANQIAGIHFTHKKKHVFYAIDDSFGLHTFDTRTDSKKKARLNPESENHNVVATALSSNGETLAVASAEFGGGILDVRGSRRRENHPHVVSLYDTRMAGEPITSYHKRFKSDVTGMEFYLNGHDLLIGDQSGAIQVFDTTLRDEDNAFRWGRYVKGPITKVGIINKRIVYTISNKSEASVFVDAKGKLEVLYGAVSETPSQSTGKVSKAYFKKPEWCAGLVKGVDDNLPLVAVHGVDNKNFISLTAMDQNGVRQATPMLSYNGHVGEVKCMTATPELLLTGGEDGKVVVQIANFRNPKFGEDMIDHHRLTIKRGDLAELQEKGKAHSEGSDDSDDEDSGKKPSTSSAVNNSSASSSSASSSPVKKVKKEEYEKEDSDDEEDSSESDSSESDDDKDPKQKAKERKKKERERKRQLKKEKEKEERRKAKEKKKKDKEEKERKEKEAAKAKKRAAREAKEQEEADRKRKAKEAKKRERELKEEAEKEEKRKEKERKKKERAELKAKEVAEKAKEDQVTQEKERQDAQKKEKQEAKEKDAKEERKAAKEREAAKEKERQSVKAKESKEPSSSSSSKDEKSKKDKPSTSEAPSNYEMLSSTERREVKDRIKAERKAAERALDPVAFDAEREKRRLAKLAETPEQRAERKQKAREERKKQREEEEKAIAENGAKRPRVE